MSRTDKKLDQAYEKALCIPLHAGSRIVLMSDCHRGIGTWGDNFQANQNLFFAALQYYNRRNFIYIELGDGDELWENRSMTEILEKHGDVFALLRRFYCENRLYMLYGNHDLKKKKGLLVPCFPDIPVYESIFLENGDQGLLLLHGHQGDLWNERLWYVTRFLVRYLWRPLEQLGVKDPTSAAKNYRKKERVERRMAEWAKKNQQPLVAGHTHRPYFSTDSIQGWYFNSGSGVHPYSVTALEIVRGSLSLVKWSLVSDYNQYVRVEKERLAGPLCLSELFA